MAGSEFLLHFANIDSVIVHRVQGCCRWRWYPGAIRPSLGMSLFGVHHLFHFIWLGPHSLADLRLARKSAANSDIDVPVLVSKNPGLLLDRLLRQYRARAHTRMDFVAGTIKKSSIDEYHPALGRINTAWQVDSCTTLFVHDADLNGVSLKFEHLLNATEQRVREGNFLGAVHLRFYDIDAARPTIGPHSVSKPIRQCTCRRDDRVENSLEDVVAVGVSDSISRHQVADIANQQDASTGQNQLLARRRRVDTIFG